MSKGAMVVDTVSQSAVRILCVGGEARLLERLESHLAMDYEVHLATHAQDGLGVLESTVPFSVVISDMRMPEMDGAVFLQHVREKFPDTTRILLTGQSDLESAIAAVNKGAIFRFLSKPCEPQYLLEAVRDAIRQHELILAERMLLKDTLNGAVGVLIDVMSLTAPKAFSRANVLKSYVKHMCQALGASDSWQYELAATLSQLGCITLPPEIFDKLHYPERLNNQEREMVRGHPGVAQRLISKIPRLDVVGHMIASQHQPAPWDSLTPPQTDDEMIALGGNLLAIALEFDDCLMSGKDAADACVAMAGNPKLNSKLCVLMTTFQDGTSGTTVKSLMLKQLRNSMILEDDVVSKSGGTILGKGRELNAALLERLHNFSKGVGLSEPIRVRVPS